MHQKSNIGLFKIFENEKNHSINIIKYYWVYIFRLLYGECIKKNRKQIK